MHVRPCRGQRGGDVEIEARELEGEADDPQSQGDQLGCQHSKLAIEIFDRFESSMGGRRVVTGAREAAFKGGESRGGEAP